MIAYGLTPPCEHQLIYAILCSVTNRGVSHKTENKKIKVEIRGRKIKMQRGNEIPIHGGSVILLHKQLKEEDRIKSETWARRKGETANTEPLIAIDLQFIMSVQEDYRTGGTLVVDKKAAVSVVEQFDDVFNAWISYKDSCYME